MVCRNDKRKTYNSRIKEKGEYAGVKRQSNAFFCDHCKINGHIQDRCWKLHSYPLKLKNNSWRKETKVTSNVSNSEHINTEPSTSIVEAKLTDNQIGQLLSLLNKQIEQGAQKEIKDSNINNAAHLASIVYLNAHNNEKWIVDIGASDHIYSKLLFFH